MEDHRIDPCVVRFVRIGLQACGSLRAGLLRDEFKENDCGAAMANVLGSRVKGNYRG